MTAALTEALARGRAEAVIHAILDGRAEPDADPFEQADPETGEV